MNASSFAAALDSPQDNTGPRRVLSAFEMLGKSPLPDRAHQHGHHQGHDQLIAQALSQALTGERRAIPTWNGAAATLRSWLKLLALWEFESQVPLEKRGIKLLQSFQEGSQPRRIADTVLLSSRGYSAILTALQEKYAPVLEASGPKAIDRFLFEGERQKGESYTSFIAAKEIARQEMESFLGEKVCDKLCGRILLRQAGLNELMITLKGPILRGFNEIAEMLRPLDRPEMLARGEDTKVTKNFHQEHYLHEFPEGYDYDHYSGNFEDHEDHIDYPYEYEPEWEYEDEPENPVAIDDEGNAHFFMEDREYTEEESKYLEAYVSAYRDVRKELQKRRTDRGYTRRGPPFRDGKGGKKGRGKFRFSGRGKGKGGDKGKGQGQMRGTSEDLVLRTRCFNCNELGHYAKDCPLQTKGAGKSTNKKMFVVSAGNNTATQPMVFMMTTNLKEMPQTDARTTQPTLAKRLMIFAGVKCRPQEALVDTAAEDAVIGSTAMRQLTIELHRRGLRPLPVSAGDGAGGIGGAAVVESMMEVPLGIASNNCVLRFTILRDSDQFQTPPLLPVSFLESVEAIIDLQNELCIINGTPTPMTRLPSAHRTINILDFDQDGWDLPVERRKNPKIDPFKLPPKGTTNFFEGGTITVWLQSTKGTTFVQTLPGDRDHLVIPNECSGLPKEGLSPHRRTFAIFADGHDITIDDRWPGPHGARALPKPWSGSVTFHVGGDGEQPFWEEDSPPPFSASQAASSSSRPRQDPYHRVQKGPGPQVSQHAANKPEASATTSTFTTCTTLPRQVRWAGQQLPRNPVNPRMHVTVIVPSSFSCLMTRLKMQVKNLTPLWTWRTSWIGRSRAQCLVD